MSTVQTWQTESTSLKTTLRLAAQIGAKLKGGELIVLVSDLGGGKTAFVKGLAQGMGSSDVVSSPSFTISNVYQAGKLSLHHFDFYRLQEAGVMRYELDELLQDKQVVVAVEWAEIVSDQFPEDRVTITIQATGETSRHITITHTDATSYLMPELA